MQVAVLLVLALVGRQAGLAIAYDVGLALAGALFAYQQWLIRDRERAPCFRAFLNNNWVGAVIFAGIVGGHAPWG